MTIIGVTDPGWRKRAQVKFPPLTAKKLKELLADVADDMVILVHADPAYAVHPKSWDGLAAATQVISYGSKEIIIGADDGNY